MRQTHRSGRDMSQLLADFGHDLPTAAPHAPATKEARLFRHAAQRGPRKTGRGWMPASAPVVPYRMTSDQAPVFWPFIAGPGLPPTGAQMGIDVLSGSAFHFDPIGLVLRDDIPVTNANVMCFGKPGTGKSGTTKAFCLRMVDFGYRILILGDPKDEYERLCHFLGVEPFVLGPGRPARINPLGLGPLAEGWAQLSAQEARNRAAIVFSRWLTLMRALIGSQRIGAERVPFGPSEEAVIKAAADKLLTDNEAPLNIRYLARVTNPGKYSATFVAALAARLADEVCETITKSTTKREGLMREYLLKLKQARRVDGMGRATQPPADGSWNDARQ